MRNTFKSNEWQNVWVHRTLKLEIQKGGGGGGIAMGDQLIQKARFPLFNL